MMKLGGNEDRDSSSRGGRIQVYVGKVFDYLNGDAGRD
jgi:hypothetical protein